MCSEAPSADDYLVPENNSYVSGKQCVGMNKLLYESDDGTERLCLADNN